MAEIKVKNAALRKISQDRCSAKGRPEDSDDGVPYDSGWSWMILCGKKTFFLSDITFRCSWLNCVFLSFSETGERPLQFEVFSINENRVKRLEN